MRVRVWAQGMWERGLEGPRAGLVQVRELGGGLVRGLVTWRWVEELEAHEGFGACV